MLLIARILQGVGAANLFPASMAMLAIIFPEEERGRALGIYGAMGTMFLASGPFVGGLFTEFLSWRWIFWINPFVVVATAAVVTALWIDPPRTPAKGRFDFGGLVSLVGGIGLVIVVVMEAPDLGVRPGGRLAPDRRRAGSACAFRPAGATVLRTADRGRPVR